MSRTDGGPAFFPTMKYRRWGEQEEGESEGGASLRDWFAGQALLAIAANALEESPDYEAAGPADGVARMAYDLADAMLRARNGFHLERRTLPRRGIAARGTGSRAAPDDSEAFVAIASQGSET